MRNLSLCAAAALALAGAPLHAAGFDAAVEPAPPPAPVVIEEEPRGTAQGFIVPLVLLALVGIAAAASHDDDDDD